MDLLQQCAQEFDRLVPYQYHVIIGRKGKTLEFTISFDRADFHHLAGLHKLRDNIRLQTGKRSDIMKEILDGRITYSDIKQSIYFHEMEPRLLPLSQLEPFLDSNKIIFRYNSKANIFSVIQADYLLQNDYEGTPVYLFLAQRSGSDTQVCRTFFPKSGKDYAEGQPRYTLLKKEKWNLSTGETIIQYDRLTPKDAKNRKAEKDFPPPVLRPAFFVGGVLSSNFLSMVITEHIDPEVVLSNNSTIPLISL